MLSQQFTERDVYHQVVKREIFINYYGGHNNTQRKIFFAKQQREIHLYFQSSSFIMTINFCFMSSKDIMKTQVKLGLCWLIFFHQGLEPEPKETSDNIWKLVWNCHYTKDSDLLGNMFYCKLGPIHAYSLQLCFFTDRSLISLWNCNRVSCICRMLTYLS